MWAHETFPGQEYHLFTTCSRPNKFALVHMEMKMEATKYKSPRSRTTDISRKRNIMADGLMLWSIHFHMCLCQTSRCYHCPTICSTFHAWRDQSGEVLHQLDEVIKDILIALGDWNAKVGLDVYNQLIKMYIKVNYLNYKSQKISSLSFFIWINIKKWRTKVLWTCTRKVTVTDKIVRH